MPLKSNKTLMQHAVDLEFNMITNSTYAIISMTEIERVNFSMICETSVDTLRKSADETKTIIKWDGNTPEFVSQLETLNGPYTYSQIKDIITTSEWMTTEEE